MSTHAQPVRQARFPFVRHYCIADSTLAVSADSAIAMQLWQSFAQRYWLTDDEPSAATNVTGTIELYGQSDAPAPPPVAKGETVTHGIYWLQGECVWLALAGATILIHPPSAQRVQVWLKPDVTQSTTAGDWVLSYALPGILRRRGLYELHAAGLSTPDTAQGILLVGDSGSGKSTLATQLAKSGWSYLSDDLLLLQPTSTAVMAWGLRRVFALTENTVANCLPAQPRSDTQAIADKYLLDPTTIFASVPTAHCQPRTLCFTTLTQQEQTHIEPISRSAAMLGLLRQSSWLCYDPLTAAAHTQALTRLVSQCQPFRLCAGRDLLFQPELADNLLRTLLP